MEKFIVYLKGIAMGIADVIPGVSGGTLALILGIYHELLNAIKAISPRPFFALVKWLKNGRNADDKKILLEEIQKLNLAFLIPLVFGILTAFGVGSIAIPYLMEQFPAATRAFFFGLIIASVAAPFRMITFDSSKVWAIAAIGIILGGLFGFTVTNPKNTIEVSTEWYKIKSSGESLKDITRRGPSAMSAEDVFWASNNLELQRAIQNSDPATYASLEKARNAGHAILGDKSSMKNRSAPYQKLEVPKDTPVNVPRLAHWFVFFAGLLAICAMILPGISGSYILLILGAYFFMLNALKGFVSTLAHGIWPTNQAGFVFLFCLGAAIGILSAARILSYLLEKHAAPTLAILVGLMLGCLRGVWPFRELSGNVYVNMLPSASTPGVGLTIAAGIVGFIIVVAFMFFGSKKNPLEV